MQYSAPSPSIIKQPWYPTILSRWSEDNHGLWTLASSPPPTPKKSSENGTPALYFAFFRFSGQKKHASTEQTTHGYNRRGGKKSCFSARNFLLSRQLSLIQLPRQAQEKRKQKRKWRGVLDEKAFVHVPFYWFSTSSCLNTGRVGSCLRKKMGRERLQNCEVKNGLRSKEDELSE